MSVAALRLAPSRPLGARLLLAASAIAAVAGAVWLLAALFAPVAPAPPARSPFGMGTREAAPAVSGIAAILLAWQSAFFAQLRDGLSALKADGAAWPALMGIGFAYGVFHAAGPGHGKAVIAAYIVSGERALRRGLALSLAAALIQACVAIALVSAVFIALGGTAAQMASTTRVVEMGGFALVAGLGLALVWRKAGRLLDVLRLDGSTARAGCDDCGHLHGPGAPDASWGSLAAVALGAGIRPCAGALVLLTFARAQGLTGAGIAAVFAMALGTATATGALAALAIYAKRLSLRLAGGRGRAGLLAGAGLELAAAALVLVLGAALLAGVWAGSA